ncbi:ParB family protein [Kineococcus sp. NUM-3379]
MPSQRETDGEGLAPATAGSDADAADTPPAEAPRRRGRPRKETAQPGGSAVEEKKRVGYYQTPSETDRARGCYEYTRLATGYRSFSDFIAAAVMEKCEALERQYNGGEPFPAMEPGELPTGRPLQR